MKAYQKMAKIIPVAVLSTSVLFAPAMSFAAEKHEKMRPTAGMSQHINQHNNTQQMNKVDKGFKKHGRAATVDAASQTGGIRTLAEKNDIDNWTNSSTSSTSEKVDVEGFITTVTNAINNKKTSYYQALVNRGDVFDPVADGQAGNMYSRYTSHSSIGYTYMGSQSQKLTAEAIGDGSPVSVSSLERTNNTNLEQTADTEAKSYQSTSSFTVSNTEGVAVKISSTTEAKVDIPFVAEAKTSVTMGLDTSYSHTSSDTLSKTETLTFPSQKIALEPHGTTRFNLEVYEQKFSGVDTASNVGIDTTLSFVSKDGDAFTYNVSLYDAVQAYIKEGNTLPNGVTLDKNNKQVIITGAIETKFSGVLGYASKGTITFIPDSSNTTQKETKMSLEEYNNPTTRARLLAK